MVTRLSGGLTPADGADPRTFPTIWNSTATEIETAQSDITTLQGSVTANGTAVTTLQSDVATAQSDITTLQSDVADRVVKNARSGQFFVITGERNGNINTGEYWAWGNGSSTNEWPVLYDCVLVGAAIWAEAGSSGTLTAQMQVNGVAQGAGSELSVTGAAGDVVATTTFATAVSLSAGDEFTPVCITNTGTSVGSTINITGYWT